MDLIFPERSKILEKVFKDDELVQIRGEVRACLSCESAILGIFPVACRPIAPAKPLGALELAQQPFRRSLTLTRKRQSPKRCMKMPKDHLNGHLGSPQVGAGCPHRHQTRHTSNSGSPKSAPKWTLISRGRVALALSDRWTQAWRRGNIPVHACKSLSWSNADDQNRRRATALLRLSKLSGKVFSASV